MAARRIYIIIIIIARPGYPNSRPLSARDRTRRVYNAKIRAELISTDKPLSLQSPPPHTHTQAFLLYILYVDRAGVIKF